MTALPLRCYAAAITLAAEAGMWQFPSRILTAAALAALGACSSSGGTRQQEALQRYLAYAGAPIKSFTWLGQFYSWDGLAKDKLVVFTTPSDAYLLSIAPPCDMRFVINRIGLTSTGGTVYARLDSVIADTPGTGRWTCPINEIRPVDYKRMRAEGRTKAQPVRDSGAAPAATPPPQ